MTRGGLLIVDPPAAWEEEVPLSVAPSWAELYAAMAAGEVSMNLRVLRMSIDRQFRHELFEIRVAHELFCPRRSIVESIVPNGR